MDIKQYMSKLSDAELLAAAEQAYKDLKQSAKEHPESERHQYCFAGLCCYAQECQRRRLTVTV